MDFGTKPKFCSVILTTKLPLQQKNIISMCLTVFMHIVNDNSHGKLSIAIS